MNIIGYLALGAGIGYGIYEAVRCRYEAFGLIVSGKGGAGVDIKKFHTEKKALEHFHKCKEKYGLACMRKI